MMEVLGLILADPNARWVTAGTLLLGISSGMLGCFALLRGRSLMGDVLAHTALPGVAAAFMLTRSKSVAPLLAGAVLAGLAGSWCVNVITRHSRIKEDTAQGLVLTVFFGAGVVLLTEIARTGVAGQSGLNRFLFGQAASLVPSDVQVIGLAALLLVGLLLVLFKEFKLLAFDRGFGSALGLPMRTVDGMLNLLIVAGVAIGLQSVGVVLMASLLVTPAAAARYWTDRLGAMVALAGAVGGLAGVTGTWISLLGPRMPTGPLIVLAATAFFMVSAIFGTRRGILRKAIRMLRTHRRIRLENLLRTVYEAYERQSGSPGAVGGREPETARAGAPADRTDPLPGPVRTVELVDSLPAAGRRLKPLLRTAARRGWLEILPVPAGGRAVRLTAAGLAKAQELTRRHRLWEMYLMYEAEFAADHVDRDADDIEHYLPPEVVAELEHRWAQQCAEKVVPPSVHPL